MKGNTQMTRIFGVITRLSRTIRRGAVVLAMLAAPIASHVQTVTLFGALPTAVNGEKVTAEYKDGVLKVTLPKKEEIKPKPIKIEAA